MTSLPESEVRALAELLAPAFDLLLPAQLRAHLPPAPPGVPPSVEALQTWLASLTDAQLRPLLSALVENDRVRAVLARLEPAGGRADGRAPHVILANRLPVVDRVEIWSRLQALHTGVPRILSVRGLRGAGKTYTAWLVMEYCQRLGQPHHALHPLDLEGMDGLSDIVTAVLGMLGSERPVPHSEADTTPKAWARVLAAQVFRGLTCSAKTHWLIFDHFERTARKDDVVAFFHQLALLIATATSANAPRLVLIDHVGGVPAIARGITVEEEVRTATSTDIHVFVSRCRPQWSSDQRDAEVSRILGKLPPALHPSSPDGSAGPRPRCYFMEELGIELLTLTS